MSQDRAIAPQPGQQSEIPSQKNIYIANHCVFTQNVFLPPFLDFFKNMYFIFMGKSGLITFTDITF